MLLLGAFAHEAGDDESAGAWFEKAADADAMLVLGKLAEEAGDLQTARTWFERAAEAGDENARRALEELGD